MQIHYRSAVQPRKLLANFWKWFPRKKELCKSCAYFGVCVVVVVVVVVVEVVVVVVVVVVASVHNSWYEAVSIFHLHFSRLRKILLFSLMQLQVMNESPPKQLVIVHVSPCTALRAHCSLTSPLSKLGADPHPSSSHICQNQWFF